MKVSIILRHEMMGCELQQTHIEGVYHDNGTAYTIATMLQKKYKDDYVDVYEEEVIDNHS